MKLKLTGLLAAGVAAMGLLLGTSAAQAEPEVIFEGNVAHGIRNLDVDGVLYDVAFLNASPINVYGDPPTFDFTSRAAAKSAAFAARDALNTVPAVTAVGPPGGNVRAVFSIGIVERQIEPFGIFIRLMVSGEVVYIMDVEGGDVKEGWVETDPDVLLLTNPTSIADFSLVSTGPEPTPVAIGGTVIGLEGSGLVLQNNGTDNLPIVGNDPFTFDTSLTPGDFYNVTVFTNPTNPAQTCSVENGSGQVPTEDVTNVAVSCGEVVVSDVINIAAEGDTLPDGTLLTEILLQGGVAINSFGNVAFGGRDDDGTDAVFIQDGLVVAEGATLPDGTLLATFRDQGEVAINVGQLGDTVAFHGQDGNNTDTVFTQDGAVAAEGDPLPDGTLLDEINDEGKVAINDLGEVAFHGKIQIEGGFFDERLRAVFTSDGQTTQVAALEGELLKDGTTRVVEILESGGVANNVFGDVAFHGRIVDPDAGGDTVKAVFTSDGLVAAEGDKLNDGITIVDDIEENGGVAMNLFGEVAFHGRTGDIKAVFTQDGLVAKEGDTLTDGTLLDEIHENGGVAINIFGEVAFHGRTGSIKAVFTQDGLVARKGDNLADLTTLDEIYENGGVAMNFFGEVAFHGLVDGTDAVLVGQAIFGPEDEDSD